MSAPTALSFALELAAAGYHLAPVTIRRNPATGRKMPTYHGKWRELSTTDPGVIRDWAAQYGPDLSFCVDCAASGIVVIDLDVKSDGSADAVHWWGMEGLPAGGMVVNTPTGGMHLYYKAGGHGIPNSTGAIADGVDVRGDGGHVYAPGSHVVGDREVYALFGDVVPASSLDVVPDVVLERIPQARSLRPAQVNGERRRLFTDTEAAEFIRPHLQALRASRDGNTNTPLNIWLKACSHFVPNFGDWDELEERMLAELRALPHYRGDDEKNRGVLRAVMESHAGDWIAERREPGSPGPSQEPFSGPADGRRTVQLVRASSFVMRATDWAWDRRIPVGGLTLLAGREGDGKSTLMYTTLAQVTRGTLAGDLHGTPRNVAVAATEDSWELTIVPRLVAASADLDRVFHIEVVNSFGAETVLQLPHDLDATERALREAEVPLLLLDPLMSRLEGRLDTHKDGEVRQALEPLVALADRARCAVVGLIHLNKSNGTDPLNAIMASKAFVAVARSVLFVMRDPDDEQRRQRTVGLVKANLTADDDVPTLGFTIESRTVGHDPNSGKPITAGALIWGEETNRSIRDMISAAADDPDIRSSRDEAAAWLKDYLTQQGGGAPRKDIVAAGRKEDFSESTLKRAAAGLRLEMVSAGFPRTARWSLPGTSTVGSPAAGSSQVSPETCRSSSVGSAPGESGRTELTGLTVDSLAPVGSVGPVRSVRPSPPAREPTGAAACSRCRHQTSGPLVLGRCHSCAYPGDAPDADDSRDPAA